MWGGANGRKRGEMWGVGGCEEEEMWAGESGVRRRRGLWGCEDQEDQEKIRIRSKVGRRIVGMWGWQWLRSSPPPGQPKSIKSPPSPKVNQTPIKSYFSPSPLLFAAEQPSPSSLLFDDKKIPQRVKKLSHLECSLPPALTAWCCLRMLLTKLQSLTSSSLRGTSHRKVINANQITLLWYFWERGTSNRKVINGIRMTAAVIYLW